MLDEKDKKLFDLELATKTMTEHKLDTQKKVNDEIAKVKAEKENKELGKKGGTK